MLDSFAQVQRVEWDTFLFFFGIIFAIGGMGVIDGTSQGDLYVFEPFEMVINGHAGPCCEDTRSSRGQFTAVLTCNSALVLFAFKVRIKYPTDCIVFRQPLDAVPLFSLDHLLVVRTHPHTIVP